MLAASWFPPRPSSGPDRQAELAIKNSIMSTVTVGETTATVAAYRTAQQDVAVVANSMRDKAVDDWQVKVAEAGGPIGVYFDKSKAWEYWADYQDVVKSFVELSCCNSGRSRDHRTSSWIRGTAIPCQAAVRRHLDGAFMRASRGVSSL